MIRFIDINTGNIFNGEQPYCFWFDKGQSTQLNYVKQICLISEKEELLCQIKNEGIFNILNLNPNSNNTIKYKNVNINQKNYKDLNNFKVKPINGFINYKSYGYKYNSYFIHTIYIYALSDKAGSYQQELTIDEQNYLIGADFYNENEFLKSNLQNQGFEIPDAVQKAIYESNLHEESRDNILLNRKFKELLIEYKNILMNKGSYKSLTESLNWFEYGNLIKIKEYWQSNSFNKDLYHRKDLNKLMTNELLDVLDSYKKTTYIGLYLALTKIKVDENGNIKYNEDNDLKFDINGVEMRSAKLDRYLKKEQPDLNRVLQIGAENVEIYNPLDYEIDINEYSGSNWKCLDTDGIKFLPEPNPELEFIASQFSKEELALKMTLLGNFYATYFMPIHLDLIHSTIEDIVFTNTLKVINGTLVSRNDYVDSVNNFKCNLKPENILQLNNVNIGVNSNTTLANLWQLGQDYDDINILGVDKLEDITNISNDDIKTFYSQLYSGIGVIQPIECSISVNDDLTFMQKIQISYVNQDDIEKINSINEEYQKNVQIIEEEYQKLIHDYVQNIINEYDLDLSEEELKELYIEAQNIYEPEKNEQINQLKNETNDKIKLIKNPTILSYDYIIKPDENKNIKFKFNILFKKAEKYNLNIRFILNNSKSYIRNFKFNIYPDTQEDISIYKCRKLNQKEIENVLNGVNYNWNLFAFSTNPSVLDENQLKYEKYYTQYICEKNNQDNVGLSRLFKKKIISGKDNIINLFKKIDPTLNIDLDNYDNYLKYNDILENNLYINDIQLKNYLNTQNFIGNICLRNEYINNQYIPTILLYFLQKGFYNNSNEYVLTDNNHVLYKDKIKKWKSHVILKAVASNKNNYLSLKYNSDIKDNIKLNLFVNDNFIKDFDVIDDQELKIFSPLRRDDKITLKFYNKDNDFFIIDNLIYKNLIYTNYSEPDFKLTFKDGSKLFDSYDDSKYDKVDKFIPQFHKLLPLTNDKAEPGDVICFKPHFKYTEPIRSCRWEIINDSLNEIIKPQNADKSSANINEPFALKFKRKELNPGYYSIKLIYSLDNLEITKTLNSCFYIEK